MNGALALLFVCASLRIVIFRLDRLDMQKGPSMPLQVAALVISLLTGIAPLLAIHFGWVEQSAASVIVAGAAFIYFSVLKRHRFVYRMRQQQ